MSGLNKKNNTVVSQFRQDPAALGLILTIFVGTVIALHLNGRLWWCPAGDLSLWSWNIWSQHNSQHILDPYSFTHMLHGVLEFWLIGIVFRNMPLARRLVFAVLIESSWEVAENSSFVIERYRAATISLNYFGDSIINSVSDICFCSAGFLLANKIRFWPSFGLFVATEALLAWRIHDSLLINILMLLYPIDAIKAWQMAA